MSIEPALNEAEWAEGYDSPDLTLRLRNSMVTEGYRLDVTAHAHPLGGGLGYSRDIPALAAFALHALKYFTHEDVDLLRRAVVMEPYGFCDEPATEDQDATDKVSALADRIEALLPPREGT